MDSPYGLLHLFLTLENLPVFTYSKLNSNSCDYWYQTQARNFSTPRALTIYTENLEILVGK